MVSKSGVINEQYVLYNLTGKGRHTFTAGLDFNNVGQGLFYTGKIVDFNFIYDCGSTKRGLLNSIVINYKKHNLTIPRLDLLILSHLHEDHIAGLNTLFKRPKVSVNTAVLPYLPPIERLMIALINIRLPRWFYRFWADPVHFLIEKGVERVLLLGGSEANPPDDLRSERRFENEEERLDISEMPDDDLLLNEVIEKDGQWKKLLDQRKLLTKSHNGYMYLQVPRGLWVFRFFNCRVKDSKMNQFERCVKQMAKGISLTNVIQDRSKLQQLRKCYMKLQKNFNDTSVVVYHASIMGRHGKVQPQYGHLLTGDVNFNQKWNEVRKHFGNVISTLSLCLVPHHGAKSNWNKTSLTEVPQGCLWVVSSGNSNKFGHPNCDVVKDIIRNGSQLFWSNETVKVSTRTFL